MLGSKHSILSLLSVIPYAMYPPLTQCNIIIEDTLIQTLTNLQMHLQQIGFVLKKKSTTGYLKLGYLK